MAEPPFIQFENITKILGKNIILENVNLNIPYGEIYGVIGKSGSGKTTLLRVLVGFLSADKGRVLFHDIDVKEGRQSVQQQFGFAAQEGSFYDKLTVKENLEYFGHMYNLSSVDLKEKIIEILRLVNLEDAINVQANRLSAGMQKRLDIACSIIHDPKVLILDEPTEDLDPSLRKEILNLLKKINKEKKVTIIITSHLLNEIEGFCTMIAILHNKTILESGTVNELKDLYSKNQEIHVETVSGKYEALARILKKKKDVKRVVIKGHKLILYSPRAEKVLKEVLSLLKKRKEKLMDIDLNKPSLDEVFEAITGRADIKTEENV